MVQVAILEHKKEQELEDIKNTPTLLFADIGGFEETADLKFPDSIAKLTFHCIFCTHIFMVFCYHMGSTSFMVFCWIGYSYDTRFRCYFVVNT